MEDPADDAPRLAAAPRHLRRRALHEEIPDTLLVPGAEPFVEAAQQPGSQASPPGTVKPRSADGVASYRRKRRLALSILVILSLSVPLLVFLLLVSA
jgi:hypothetical protein